jgi:hypothetical protein
MEPFRELMEERWREFERQASAVGEGGNMVSVRANAWYRTLDPTERSLADQVLADWVLLDTPRQGPVLALIWESRIRSTEPALQQLAAKLDRTPGPAAKDLKEKVQRVLGALRAPTTEQNS